MVFANVGVSIPVFVLGLLHGLPVRRRPQGHALRAAAIRSPESRRGRRAAGRGLGSAGLDRSRRRISSTSCPGLYIFSSFITGQWGATVDAFRHLILPAIALGTIPLAIIARITRSSLLEVLGLDYVRTARAKGLDERGVVMRHAARNALLPVVTIIGLQLGALLSGAVLTETVFNLAGVGRSLFEAITGRDYVVIQGFTLLIAIIYVVVNLAVDISYGFLDPRVRLR